MKTYYMITTNLTFYINIKEGGIPFIQAIAEMLMCYRGFGCTEYNFSTTIPKKAFEIDLTAYYNNYYREFYETK